MFTRGATEQERSSCWAERIVALASWCFLCWINTLCSSKGRVLWDSSMGELHSGIIPFPFPAYWSGTAWFDGQATGHQDHSTTSSYILYIGNKDWGSEAPLARWFSAVIKRSLHLIPLWEHRPAFEAFPSSQYKPWPLSSSFTCPHAMNPYALLSDSISQVQRPRSHNICIPASVVSWGLRRQHSLIQLLPSGWKAKKKGKASPPTCRYS